LRRNAQRIWRRFPGCSISTSVSIYNTARRFDQAIDQISKALEIDPDDLANHRYLADAYAFAGRPEKAIEQCEKVIGLGRGVMSLQV
jgi:tetratricopeptide (TPR) repeat protein